MAKAYGIDLGTTFSAISFINEHGTPEIICNQSQGEDKLMPSVVQYHGASVSDGYMVGTPAAVEAEICADRTVEFAKRYIDNKEGEYEFPSGIPEGEGPVEVSSIILKAIKEYAKEAGHDVENVVITVPAYFGVRGRDATKRAASIAGLNVLHIISEPTAAAMYYCEHERPDNKNILVYDLGGGTFDVVVVKTEVSDDDKLIFKSLAVEGNKQLGGKDWDDALAGYIFDKAREQLSEDIDYDSLDPDDKQKIRDASVACKRAISKVDQKEAKIKINGKSTGVLVTREIFESITSDLLSQTMVTVDKTLEQCGLSTDEIDLVLLVGGSTFMPMVQNAVKQKFGEEKVKVNNPNEAVALGAAICAQKLQDIIEDYNFEEEEKEGTEVSRDRSETSNFGELGKTRKSVVDEAVTQLGGEIVSHSFGALISGGVGQFDRHIDNLIYKGDSCPAECSKIYSAQGNGGLRVRFYENDCRERLVKDFEECDSDDEYYNENSEHFIFVTIDDETNEVITSDKPNVKVDSVGVLVIENPDIKEGDAIDVKISYWNEAIAIVTHVATGKEYMYNLVHGSDEEHRRILEQDQQRAEEAKKAKLYLA